MSLFSIETITIETSTIINYNIKKKKPFFFNVHDMHLRSAEVGERFSSAQQSQVFDLNSVFVAEKPNSSQEAYSRLTGKPLTINFQFGALTALNLCIGS